MYLVNNQLSRTILAVIKYRHFEYSNLRYKYIGASHINLEALFVLKTFGFINSHVDYSITQHSPVLSNYCTYSNPVLGKRASSNPAILSPFIIQHSPTVLTDDHSTLTCCSQFIIQHSSIVLIHDHSTLTHLQY